MRIFTQPFEGRGRHTYRQSEDSGMEHLPSLTNRCSEGLLCLHPLRGLSMTMKMAGHKGAWNGSGEIIIKHQIRKYNWCLDYSRKLVLYLQLRDHGKEAWR